jgi:hypothetical protein
VCRGDVFSVGVEEEYDFGLCAFQEEAGDVLAAVDLFVGVEVAFQGALELMVSVGFGAQGQGSFAACLIVVDLVEVVCELVFLYHAFAAVVGKVVEMEVVMRVLWD